MITIYDMVDLPPIIPPWTTAQVEEAWPVRVQPWPPVEVGMILEDPADPWSRVVYPIPALNPECRSGKHRNCDEIAMCDEFECDRFHPCTCECHWTRGAES